MFQKIKERCEILSKNFKEINPERKALLEKLATHIQRKIDEKEEVNLVYVCTHNSRRSHLGQVWSKVAADFYGFDIHSFSAGTEVTAFNQNAINALIACGFEVKKSDETANPKYEVLFGESKSNLCFSKTYIFLKNMFYSFQIKFIFNQKRIIFKKFYRNNTR